MNRSMIRTCSQGYRRVLRAQERDGGAMDFSKESKIHLTHTERQIKLNKREGKD